MFEKICNKAGSLFKLIVKHGTGHGRIGMNKDMAVVADWFDEYLCGVRDQSEGVTVVSG